MKIGVAIQLNCTREEELFEFQMALREIGVEPIYYGIIPFTTETTGVEDFSKYDKVLVYGSVKVISLWQNGFMPKETVVFYNEWNFDQLGYSNIMPKRHLLNGDAKFGKFGYLKDLQLSEDRFVKPSKDLKAFPGIIVPQGKTIYEEVFSKQLSSSFSENADDEVIMIAPLKEIKKEFRNFIIDGKIIDSSIYKIGSKITYEVPTDEEREGIQKFFECLCLYYEPHDCYVADFALLEDGSWNLIEYNCINCAGMYAVDRRKVFKAMIECAQRV